MSGGSFSKIIADHDTIMKPIERIVDRRDNRRFTEKQLEQADKRIELEERSLDMQEEQFKKSHKLQERALDAQLKQQDLENARTRLTMDTSQQAALLTLSGQFGDEALNNSRRTSISGFSAGFGEGL